MGSKEELTTEELELIKEKLETVKKARHGEVIIKIADGKVVYISHSIGERVTGEQVKTK